jgi:hypothetical protein
MRTMTMMLCLITFLLWSSIIWAHPAKSIELTYDKTTKILTANVVHEVKDNFKHYIKTVEIKLTKSNGLIHNLVMQDNMTGGVYEYKLNDVKVGDTVTLTTSCNFIGKKSASITIK